MLYVTILLINRLNKTKPAIFDFFFLLLFVVVFSCLFVFFCFFLQYHIMDSSYSPDKWWITEDNGLRYI